MANLKDINYGIGKYLVASDASDFPDIGTNRTNLDLLNFKVATNNAYALYNFKDGMIDAYQTSGGVDAGASTGEIYNSTDKTFDSADPDASTGFTVTGSLQTFTVPAGVTSVEIKCFGASCNNVDNGGFSKGNLVTSGSTQYAVVVGQKNNSAGSGNWNSYSYGGGGRAYNYESGAGLTGVFTGTADPSFTSTTDQARAIIIAGGGGARGHQGTAARGDGGGASGTSGENGAGTPWGGGGTQSAVGGGGGGGAAGTVMRGGESSGGTEEAAAGGGYYGGGGGGNAGGSGGGSGYVGTQNNLTAGLTYVGASSEKTSDADYPGANIAKVLFKYSLVNDISLVSNTQTANAEPTEGRLMIYEEDVDSVTLDTDLKGYVSRDGGTTYTQVTLAEDTIYAPAIAFNQGGNDSYTKLLLHCDGSNNGTTWTDSSSSGHTVTMSSGSYPRTETGTKKFGTASGKWNNASYLQVPDSADWHFGSGDYTVDFWLYHPQHCSTDHFDFIIAQPNAGGGNQSYIGTRRAGSGNYYMMTNFSGQSTQSNADITVTLNEWNHWAIVKNSGSVYFYKDGVNVMGTGVGVSAPVAWPDYNVPLRIGYQQDVEYYNGYADEIRISKGIARWTTDFVPATRLSEAYNAGSYTEAEGSIRLVSGSVDISGQPSGTNMKYKIETLNSKNLKLHGASLLWA
jgi:hypothetical protein